MECLRSLKLIPEIEEEEEPMDLDKFKRYIDEKFDSLAVKVNKTRGIAPV